MAPRPLRIFTPRDLGINPTSVGIPDARTPGGGLDATTVDLMRGMRNQPTPTGVVTSGESQWEYDYAAIELPFNAATFDNLTGIQIPGPERIAWCRATWTGFGDATWGDMTWGSVEVTRSVRLTGGEGAFPFPWLVGGTAPPNNTLPSIRIGVQDATTDGLVALSIVIPNP